ncbi:RHS repeat domain-containing protein [Flavobacterium sp. MAHUQ-51]|uniref:RHS repeat domain-containing protein n=1 Tax=Flavobacterium sp. GCM10022190 TaxID=3252639 RepID=UPI0036219C8A
MKRHFFLLILLCNLISCGNLEENSLLEYSEKNKSYQITITENNLNEKDSIIRRATSVTNIYDSKNNLINSNNLSFYFYNSQNKLSETKSVYKREGKGLISKILKHKYLYDKNGKLIKIIDNTKNDVIIWELKYDKFGNLKSEIGLRETINYEYLNGKVIKKTVIEDNEISKVSEYKYDKLNRIEIEDWVFSGTNRMKTYYKYNSNNKLFSKRDSSFSKITNPNQYIEFLTEYYYDKNDSLIEIRKLGRIYTEKEFKIRGKTKFKYLKE